MKYSLFLFFLYIFTNGISVLECRKKHKEPLKWGIAAAGKISHDFANSFGALSPAKQQVVAVAARKNLTRAQEFATQFGIPKAYAGYYHLAENPDIDIVYIGNINPQHFSTAKLMLEYGKNVLCEKPLTMNRKQSQILTTLAKTNNVFFAEGLWSRYLPVYQFIRQQIREGKLGKIISADAELGVARTEERYFVKELGGGAILDVGVYCVDVMQWIFEQEPRVIKATGVLNDDGVDTDIKAEFSYLGNRKAKCKLSITKALLNRIIIVGTKGSMTVPIFWYATSVVDVYGVQHNFSLPTGAKYPFINTNRAGLAYEAEAIRKFILAGKKESDVAPHAVSLGHACVEDEIRKQLGVVSLTDYNEDYINPNLAI